MNYYYATCTTFRNCYYEGTGMHMIFMRRYMAVEWKCYHYFYYFLSPHSPSRWTHMDLYVICGCVMAICIYLRVYVYKIYIPGNFSWLRDWEEWMTGKCWISNWTNIWVDWQLVSQIYMSGCFLFSLLIYTIVCVLYIKYIYHVTFMSDDCDSSIKWNNWQVKIKNFELLKDTEVEYSIHYIHIYKKVSFLSII